MKKTMISLLALSLTIVIGCKDENKKVEETEETIEEVVEEVKEVKVEAEIAMALESKSGSNATGKVSIVQKNGMVSLQANLYGLEEGTHAIHIHEKADCSSSDGKSTGGHWNPTFTKHGKWGEGEYHLGDIGNFEANAEGEGQVRFETDQWCIGCGDEKKDIVGKAIIVHQGADDFTSQPSGAAGARVSCGGIIQ